eukprot:g14761.t1
MNLVKGILREYDRGCYGEDFRGDRLAKIGILGKGSTSTVWKVVDVDYLRVVAVKEMVVCNKKQTAILRHELSVLHPQLQHLIPPKKFRLSGRKSSNKAALAAAVASVNKMREADSSAGPPAGAGNGSSQRINSGNGGVGSGKDGKSQVRGGAGGGRNSSSTSKGAAGSLEGRPVKCPYMPRYFGSFVSQDVAGRPCVSIVLEHVSGVDLSRWIERMGATTGDEQQRQQQPQQPQQLASPTSPTPLSYTQPQPPPPIPPISIPEAWLARVCRDMLEALRYLHERRRIHRDVKPGNLLLGPEGARLVDFGSTIGENEEEGDRMHGTIRFMSPERLCAKPYRPSSDLWAAGLTIASAALGENPIPHSHNKFENAEYAEAAFRLVREHRAAAALSQSLLSFLKAALEADPDKRPTVDQMLAHPFLRANPDAAEGDLGSGDFGSGDGGGGGGGGGGASSGGGGGFLGKVRRGGSVLNIGGRKKNGERARSEAAAVAALENREMQQRQQQQQNQQRQQRLLSSAFSSHSSTSGGGGGGVDRLDEAWSEPIRETLRRLARESIGDVDASDVIRRVLTARKSRWKNPMGSGDISLKSVDYSHLAAELDVSSAELRSLFGTLLTNMDGEEGESSSSWSSSSTDSPRSSSPPPAMLPPLGATPPPPPPPRDPTTTTTTTHERSRFSSRDTEGEAMASPLRLPYARRELPRRRPTPLVLSPGAVTPRPVSAVSASALSTISGMTAQSATGDSPTAAAAAAAAEAAASTTLASRVSEESTQSLPVSRTESATLQRSVSATTWTRGWAGMNRSRRVGDSRRSVSGGFATRAGVSAAARAHAGKEASVVVLGSSGDSGSERGAGIPWWKWPQRRRLFPRVFKADKPGGGDASGGDGSSDAEEMRMTEPPSAASRATASGTGAAAAAPPFAVTPPLSKFDEEADGSVGGGKEPAPAAFERDVGLGVVREPLSLGAPALGEVALVGMGATGSGSGLGLGSPFTTALESRLEGCDGPAPAWTPSSMEKMFSSSLS